MKKYHTIVLFAFIWSCSAINNSPCILAATYGSGSICMFNFRKDHTFEWTTGSGLGGFSYTGKYLLSDSIITLDQIGFDNVIKSRRLLIASINPWTGQIGKYVMQVNQQNKLIDSMHIFTITTDDRKSLKW